MKKIQQYGPECMLSAGMALISLGVGAIYWPAGLITAGMCLALVGYLMARAKPTVKD